MLQPHKLVLANGLRIPLHLVAHQHFDYSPSPETSACRIRLFKRWALLALSAWFQLTKFTINLVAAPAYIYWLGGDFGTLKRLFFGSQTAFWL